MWKKRLLNEWNIDKNIKINSWSNEYKRLYSVKNLKSWATLKVHEDEVLHVSVSNSGDYLCSGSKDRSAIIWKFSEYSRKSVTIFRKLSFTDWQAIQKSSFNERDDLLLISGVLGMIMGRITIFSFPECEVIKTIENSPYDGMGIWLGPYSVLANHHHHPSMLEGSNAIKAFSVYESQTTVIYETDVGQCRLFSTCDHQTEINKKRLFFCHATGPINHHPDVIISLIITAEETKITQHDGLISAGSSKTDIKSGFNSRSLPGFKLQNICGSNMIGAILSISCSSSLEKVFVNCRPIIPSDEPNVSQKIEMRVFDFDLNLLKVFEGGLAFTPSSSVFLIHLHLSPMYILSGDEEGKIHVYDVKLNTKLATLNGHNNVVNRAVVVSDDPPVFCSASDDYSLKLWSLHNFKG